MMLTLVGIFLIIGLVLVGIYVRGKSEKLEENPYRWVKGILTLNPIPSAKEIWDMGFNVLVPYGYRYDSQKRFIQEFIDLGGKVIWCGGVRNNEIGIIAYNLMDEPDCRKMTPEEMEKKRLHYKEKTNLPLTCVICGADIGCGYGKKKEWKEFINRLDFVMLDIYPYRVWIEEGKEIEEMERCLKKEWKGIKVPIIPIIQAHSSKVYRCRKPEAKPQIDFWGKNGMGFIVYPWKDSYDGVKDNIEEWRKVLKEVS